MRTSHLELPFDPGHIPTGGCRKGFALIHSHPTHLATKERLSLPTVPPPSPFFIHGHSQIQLIPPWRCVMLHNAACPLESSFGRRAISIKAQVTGNIFANGKHLPCLTARFTQIHKENFLLLLQIGSGFFWEELQGWNEIGILLGINWSAFRFFIQ